MNAHTPPPWKQIAEESTLQCARVLSLQLGNQIQQYVERCIYTFSSIHRFLFTLLFQARHKCILMVDIPRIIHLTTQSFEREPVHMRTFAILSGASGSGKRAMAASFISLLLHEHILLPTEYILIVIPCSAVIQSWTYHLSINQLQNVRVDVYIQLLYS
jgi:hypothetical protein